MRTMPLPLKVKKGKVSKPLTVAVTPPLKWAGGKRWLLPHLSTIWEKHSHRRLVEPFAGGMAISLGLRPTSALVNDINGHLINFYRHLKKGLEVTLSFKNEPEAYYRLRNKFNALLASKEDSTPEAAQLFYYLNRTGFNGLCRFNQSGRFNVPVGRYKKINYRDEFSEYTDVLKNWTFSNKDFEELDISPDDFIYADPPYDVQFTQYSGEGFTWEDQVRAAEWLAEHKGPVVLSNQATPRIMELYRSLGFKLQVLDAPRMISCTGNRDKAREVLATRNIT